MTADEARAILKAPQFDDRLRRVGRVNTVRLPTIRRGGCIDLLPEGYERGHPNAGLRVRRLMPMTYPLPLASKRFETYSPSLNFRTDGGGLSVAVAAPGGHTCGAACSRRGGCRPAFAYLKNAEGAGGTTCAACAIVPVLGHLPTRGKGW